HGRFFDAFNRGFDRTNTRYQGVVARMLARGGRMLLVYLVLALVAGAMYLRVPSSFLPDEDQGVLFTIVQAPVGATQQRTQRVMEQVERHWLQDEKRWVESVICVQG